MKEFCDTIAINIARYETYRCWASKPGGPHLEKDLEKPHLAIHVCRGFLLALGLLCPAFEAIAPGIAGGRELGCPKISGPQKGPAERGYVKKRQKFQKYFRHFSTFFAQGKTRQISSQYFSTLFENFRAAPFFRVPFLGLLKKSGRN